MDVDDTRAVHLLTGGAPSLSPRLWSAAFAATGRSWTYDAVTVVPDELERRSCELLDDPDTVALGVTMPHKLAAVRLADSLSGAAEGTGAVNLLVPGDDGIVGHNTDVGGFTAALRDAGINPAGALCVVFGAGGVARAVVAALTAAGAEWISIVSRSGAPWAGAVSAIAADGDVDDVGTADIVVNATPVGAATGPSPFSTPVPVDLLNATHTVIDCVTTPAATPLLRAAATAGARTVDGTAMLVHQAAEAFRLVTDDPAPLAAMRAALER
jgi:shikimate dehydrogenase